VVALLNTASVVGAHTRDRPSVLLGSLALCRANIIRSACKYGGTFSDFGSVGSILYMSDQREGQNVECCLYIL